MAKKPASKSTPRARVGSGTKKASKSLSVNYRFMGLAFVIIFAGVGGYFLWRSFADSPTPPVPEYSPNTVLLKFKDNVPQATQDKLLARFSARTKDQIPQLGVKVITVPDEALDAVTEALSHNPAVQFAEKDAVTHPQATTPNDPSYTSWPYTTTQTNLLWDSTTGSSNMVVGVLDTGFTPSIPDAGTFVSNWNVVKNTADVTDNYGHGTETSGVINARGNNGVGVANTCWNCSVIGVKITADGTNSAQMSDMAKGLTYAVDHGAKIINISFSGTSASSTMQSAEQYAFSKGVLIFAAAGNDGTNGNPVEYPAADPGVIGVGALAGATDYSFQPYSEHGSWVPLAAPTGFNTTFPAGTYYPVGGTSIASPFAAGVAALVWSAYPQASAAQLKQALFANTDPITNAQSGYSVQYGRINGYKALQALKGGAVTTPPDTTAPAININTPVSGATVSGAISVNVSASDNVGVSRVELYRNGALVGTTSTSPYSFYWDTTTSANGSYTLSAKAYDAAGNVAASSGVVVNVNNTAVISDVVAPTVVVSSPASGATLGSSVTVTASASDNVGVTSMEVYLDGVLRASGTSSTISTKLSTRKLASGAHTIVVKAYDAAGNVASSSVQVTK